MSSAESPQVGRTTYGGDGPLLAPAWLTARRIGLVAGVLGAAVVAFPSVALLVGGEIPWQLAVTSTTTVLTFLVLRRAARAGGAHSAAAWTLVGSVLGGIINCSALLAVMVGGMGLFMLPMALGMGAFFGTLYGIALVPLVWATHRASRATTHAGLDRLAVLAGAWLLAVTGIAVLLGSRERPDVTQCLAPLTSGLGAFAIVVGSLRLWQRRRWLTRVISGHDRRYAVIPRCTLAIPISSPAATDATERAPMPLELPEGIPLDLESYDGVLIERTPDTAGPYRTSASANALALVRIAPRVASSRPPAAHGWKELVRPGLIVLTASASVGISGALAFMCATAICGRNVSDVGVPVYTFGVGGALAGHAFYGVSSLALLWLLSRTLGRGGSLAWSVGLPIVLLGWLALHAALSLAQIG